MPRGRARSWTDDELRHAVAASTNLTDTIRALGLRPAGGNHRSIRAHIARLGASTTHFTHERRTRGLRAHRDRARRPLDEIFRAGSAVVATVLRRAARVHLQPIVCALCGNPGTHNGRPLTLHLDHVNGVHDDNRVENLRWLCPNCHSQTPTYCGRGSRRRANRVSEPTPRWLARRGGRRGGARALCGGPHAG